MGGPGRGLGENGFGAMLGTVPDRATKGALRSRSPPPPTTEAPRSRSGCTTAPGSWPRRMAWIAWSALGEAMTFVEVDADAVARRSFIVSGRVLDAASHAGLPGLRVEAWDRLPRTGGPSGWPPTPRAKAASR